LGAPFLMSKHSYRNLSVSKFKPFAADFRSRTCGASHRPWDVRHAQLAAANHLKFENRVGLL